jgi:hypothetical protein
MRPKVWSHDDVAKWIWERTHPIDRNLMVFNSQPCDYEPIPHRFSIGAIMFKRSFWSRINGFKAAPEGVLGTEEKDLARQCAVNSRVPLLSLNTAAGHLAFGPQKETMISYYNDNKKMFAP